MGAKNLLKKSFSTFNFPFSIKMKNYKFKINGNDYAVVIQSIEEGMAEVTVNDVPYSVQIEGAAPEKPKAAAPPPPAVPATDAHPAVARTSAPSVSAGEVKSPLPGVILKLGVKEGDRIAVGDHLLVLEAMKMENNIDSDREGTVKKINVRPGDSVLEGDVLLTIG